MNNCLLSKQTLSSANPPGTSLVKRFEQLEAMIRGGQEVCRQDIDHYLNLGERYVQSYANREQRSLYLRIFYLLLDTACDSCVNAVWRKECLEHVYLPLSKIEGSTQSECSQDALRQLYQEIDRAKLDFC